MKTKKKKNNFKIYVILLYITSRKLICQCSSQKFNYLFSLQGYIQKVVNSPRRKKVTVLFRNQSSLFTALPQSGKYANMCNTSLSRIKKRPWRFRTSLPYLH